MDLDKSWYDMFHFVFGDNNIDEFIKTFYNSDIKCFPDEKDVLNAFKYFKLQDTNVVILGQDCYINSIKKDSVEIPQANGLAFSVNKEHKIPPSLKNIYKEMKESINDFTIPNNGDLTYLAKQGVLLLNCALTVKKGKSNSFAKKWKPITDKIIKYISDNNNNIVFILWGNFAKSKLELIDTNKHFIIEGRHPSPLSARYNKKGTEESFFGHNYFNRCNDYLKSKNKNQINWCKKID